MHAIAWKKNYVGFGLRTLVFDIDMEKNVIHAYLVQYSGIQSINHDH